MIRYLSGDKSLKSVLDEQFVEIGPEPLEPSQRNIKIPLKQSQRNAIASMNPMAVGRFFLFIQKILAEEILGIQIMTNKVKKTFPRMDESLSNPSLSTAVKNRIDEIFKISDKGYICIYINLLPFIKK